MNMQTLGLGAMIAAIAAGWSTVKQYIEKFYGIFFHRIKLDQFSTDVLRYLKKNYKRIGPVTREFYCTREWVKSKNKRELLLLERMRIKDKQIFVKRWHWVIFEILDSGDASVTMPRFCNIDKLLIRIARTSKFNDETKGVVPYSWRAYSRSSFCRVFGETTTRNAKSEEKMTALSTQEPLEDIDSTLLTHDRSDLGYEFNGDYFGHLYLDDDIKSCINEAIIWRDHEKWYTDKYIPWKRGWLLYGKPGTGKSAFVRALGNCLNMPIYSMELSTFDNQSFVKQWEIIVGSNAPAIILLEDIDNVFDGRNNVTKSEMMQSLTFDCLINTIDGAQKSDGIFLIITTNNIEKVDSAIAGKVNCTMTTRPGRIDKMIEFKDLSDEGKRLMSDKILGEFDSSIWSHLLTDKTIDTGAQFQERCCRLALELFWRNKQCLEKI